MAHTTLDTRAFDAFIAQKPAMVAEYQRLNTEYKRIVDALLENWDGAGAKAFAQDAQVVKTNLVGIADVLNAMCSTLVDARAIFAEVDKTLHTANQNAYNG